MNRKKFEYSEMYIYNISILHKFAIQELKGKRKFTN